MEKTTAEKIEVMQAFLDGKPIEVAHSVSGHGLAAGWSLLDRKEPNWNWAALDYRIAEDMELKAYNLYPNTRPRPCGVGLSTNERTWMRSIIDTVKRGEIY